MKDIIERLAEISLKEGRVEFFLERERGVTLEFRDTLPYLDEAFEEASLSIRYLNERGLCGITSTLSFSEEVLSSCLTLARDLSQIGKPSLYPPLASSYPQIRPYSFSAPSKEDLMSLIFTLRERVRKHREKIRLERENLNFSEREIYLIREGRVLSFISPEYSLFVSLVAESSKRRAEAYGYKVALKGEDLDAEALVERVCEKAKALSKAEKRPSLKVAILFPPECAVELLSILAFSFKGDEVVKGRSFLKEKLGKKVFSENISLLDDGIDPNLIESRPFDEEGMPQQKTLLIERGEVRSFLWDYYYGNEAGFSSTGNARRKDETSPPAIDFTNLYLLPGTTQKRDLLRKERKVFEVLEILGAHTANPISGDFSFGVSGILYEEGEVVDYLSEMALSANIFEIFQEVEVGSDLAFYGSLGSPSLLFPKMVLG
ncbi:MAG: metallopeptidase TldD-related protein [Thermodesulfobacteriaceae bacterium]|nr:metallopeptidase TldD-related protein [Thermodesulfobacteriaceae bacterium]